ncbi:MAG: hypothetical protein ACRDP6_38985 [Actinoallomurus sp.]
MSRVRRAFRLIGFLIGGVAAVWVSAHITVRIPLAIPVVFIAVILGLVAAMFRRPPAGVFTGRPDVTPTPVSSAIPMPPVSEPPAAASPAAAWAFDEPGADTDEDRW